MATGCRRHLSHKRTGTSLNSIKQTNKFSVADRQSEGRESIITRKRLKLNSLLEYNSDLLKKSKDEENEQVRLAIKCLKKGDKLKTLTDLHRLFASHKSNADEFLKHEGLQPLYSCFKSYNVEILHSSAWCVINLTAAVTSSSYSSALLGLAPSLIQYLKGSDVVMQELCAWGLANLAGDSPSNADVLHKQGCTDALIDLLNSNHHPNEERTKSVLFALINLARSNLSCIQCMHNKDIHGKLQVLLKNMSVDSTLNFELGWLLCSIYPGFGHIRLETDHLLMATKLVSDRFNVIVEDQNLLHRDKLCFPFVRCLCNLIGLDPLLARVMLDDPRIFKSITERLISGPDSLKHEILGLVSNCVVDVCSRVLISFHPRVMSGIISQCCSKDDDIATQALNVVQTMARTSAYVDSHLLQSGLVSTVTQIISNVNCRFGDVGHDGIEELLKRDQALQLKLAVGLLLDLSLSQADMMRIKLEVEEPQKLSTTETLLSRLASSDIQQVDADLAHQATQLLHFFGKA